MKSRDLQDFPPLAEGGELYYTPILMEWRWLPKSHIDVKDGKCKIFLVCHDCWAWDVVPAEKVSDRKFLAFILITLRSGIKRMRNSKKVNA